ncbi:MAG TPA: DUF3293 domain-containing protein [Vicinamibacterales bacterium]|nr:DUF3293 domain-containing protein [Vicinamibacterales bacterium]
MIYIDFEPQGTPNARPALLGVLTTHDDKPPAFTIYVLDPLLARAASARRVCRVADLQTAISETLAGRQSGRGPRRRRGGRGDAALKGPIVSWSYHDRRIVQNGDLPPRLVQQFESRWVNALPDVRRWKSRLYRDWNLPALDTADGHALKIYMKAVGYDVPRSLAPGNAARWLRHVRERLEVTGGHYRTVPARARRYWQALLEYHRHECFGIRVVYERACRELRLEAAYRQTTYRVEMDGARHAIRIGRAHRALDVALRAARATRWACITACNPQSVPLSAHENQRRDAALKRALRARHVRWVPAEARGDKGDWPAEPGVLALGVSRSLAERIGHEFGQAAVVWGRVDGKAELVWCNRLRKVTPRAAVVATP